MKATVLVPVKSLAKAKSRLTPYLTLHERGRLVLRMLDHVLKVLEKDNRFLIYVVSSDMNVASKVEEMGAGVMYTPVHGQNRSLAAASILMNPNLPLLALSADLPFLMKKDIDGLFDRIEHNDIVLAPSKEKTGTNAVFMKKPRLIPYLFGVNSLEKFRQSAQKRHLKTGIYESPSIALDIDTAEDVRKIQETGMFLTGL